jgi:N4-gp56 family major capsid protein
MANDYTGHTYGDGLNSTSGANVRVDYYDRAAIKVAVDDLIYGRFADGKTQQRNSGKTFKISRFRHILRDENVNDQGIDGEGNIIGTTSWIFNNVAYPDQAAADAAKAAYDSTEEGIEAIANLVEPTVMQVTTGGGNLYGSSRDVGNVVSAMPTLNEGADNVNRVGVTQENFEATLFRRGAYNMYTDEVALFSSQDMQMEYRTKLARLAIEMRDDDTQLGMLAAAGVRFYGGTATSMAEMGQGGEIANVTYDFVRKIVKRLKINRAQRNTEMITGSTKFGTTPINRAFYGITGPDVVYDLEGVAEFRAIHEYGYASNLAQGEIGSIHECRFIETNRAMMYEGKGADASTNPNGYANDGTNFNVYPIIFPTKGSYATVGLQGKGGITFKAKAPGTISDTDTYGVKGIFSFNYFFASLALQPERLLIAYVCASE